MHILSLFGENEFCFSAESFIPSGLSSSYWKVIPAYTGRLPVPGLWLDVFQKIKALGFNGVSFYVNWALLEGQQEEFIANGIFAFEPFFEAAVQAGIYLLAVRTTRPYYMALRF